MEKLTIEYIPVDDLVMYENNPRRNEDAVDGVANSIEDFDFNVPIVINKQNVILSGHTRLLAAKKLGLKEVPCVRKTKLTKSKQDAYRLADNKTAERAEWDEELLAEELERLESEGEEMDRYGFDQLLEEASADEIVEDDFEPEIPEEPKTQLGDMYQLGDHILMCGDSTSEEALLKLMGGAERIWFSPIRHTESQSEQRIKHSIK